MQLVEPKSRTWTRSEYHQMGDLGWFEGQRVELVEGDVIVMSPQNFPHARIVDRVAKLLHARVGQDHWVRSQLPLVLPDESEPEPDVSVVIGQEQDYVDHPNNAVLVVEVSDATLRFDRRRKARTYARAGIPHYWIVNLVDRVVEVHQDPQPDADEPAYASSTVLKPGEALTFPGRPDVQLQVSELLP